MTETITAQRPVRVQPGQVVRLKLPFSEVCMHMRVAGHIRQVRITEHRYPAAQILNEDGSNFSFGITLGEAGIYTDDHGYYCYPQLVLDEQADRLAYAILMAAFAEYGVTREAVVKAAEAVLATTAIDGDLSDLGVARLENA